MSESETKQKPKEGKRKIVRGLELTEKQEKFAQGLAAGKHFDQAYKEAYNCSNMQADTI